jgi:two-component system nitrate/nitrite response regulator NarL
MEETTKRTVGACETQPITAEGLRLILRQCSELEYSGAARTLADGVALVREVQPDILLLDKGFGAHAILAWITELRDTNTGLSLVVWGNSISEPEALRLLQHGVRGILRKTASPESVLACLKAVASGNSWMEDSLFRDAPQRERYHRSELTPREKQVLELVEQGMKNKDIARELGIRPGTVKIHLKHIFEKTGVRGRYGLALTGMRDKGLLSLPRF